jgi:hypothetical protein
MLHKAVTELFAVRAIASSCCTNTYVAYSPSSLKFSKGDAIIYSPHRSEFIASEKKMGPTNLVVPTAYHTVTFTPCNSNSCIYLIYLLTSVCYYDCLCNSLGNLNCEISLQWIEFTTKHCFTKLVRKPQSRNQDIRGHVSQPSPILPNVSYNEKPCFPSSHLEQKTCWKFVPQSILW